MIILCKIKFSIVFDSEWKQLSHYLFHLLSLSSSFVTFSCKFIVSSCYKFTLHMQFSVMKHICCNMNNRKDVEIC